MSTLFIPCPPLFCVPGLRHVQPALVVPVSAWTVGIVSTFTSILCVVAADVGAFFVGKSLGRTKLTDISPKKTVEGALGGLASSVGTALAMQKLTAWPATPAAAAMLGLLIFFSSLFGDLIESIIKRDAEMKDSGNMIPGHGGLLDRFDSYIFTGAMVYFFNLYVLPVML
uniref:Phosphatidate cytidylyltransferase n=1 Tax=Chlamydomonas euryale TaxID=1486919 RepID=A0A7R9V3Q7_9CHLO|mmetsp:Transcript_14076/g.40833  ORF Transcript_14076/g.40833 Transcript_14076/m.40833 type:complete len:170 (+) Transcript_14076:212-721(+)